MYVGIDLYVYAGSDLSIHLSIYVSALSMCTQAGTPYLFIYLYTYTTCACIYTNIQIDTPIPVYHTATHCNTLQHTATHCNTLQHTATHCTTLPRMHIYSNRCIYLCIDPHILKAYMCGCIYIHIHI